MRKRQAQETSEFAYFASALFTSTSAVSKSPWRIFSRIAADSLSGDCFREHAEAATKIVSRRSRGLFSFHSALADRAGRWWWLGRWGQCRWREGRAPGGSSWGGDGRAGRETLPKRLCQIPER